MAMLTMPGAQAGGADASGRTAAPRPCADCGRPLPARPRPGVTRCRVCAAQAAQAYLLEALAGRRRVRRAGGNELA